MKRKRTRRLTLVLLGTAGLMASGCGDKTVEHPQPEGHPAARLDEATAKRTVTASTASAASDAMLHATAILAAGPQHGLAAPLDLARVAMLTDQAAETYDVGINNAQLPKGKSGNGSDYQPRSHYHYHHGPGIGWFLFGMMLGRSFSTPYVPPSRYQSTPRPVNPSSGYRSHIPGSGRSPTPAGGSVSRGGFGGSGSGHATGGGS